jgi:hypothetical protein
MYTWKEFKSWKASCRGRGIPINDKYLFSLNYTHDQIVLSQDAFDVEYIMRKLKQSYNQLGPLGAFQQNLVYGGELRVPADLLIDDLITLSPLTHCKYLGVSIIN